MSYPQAAAETLRSQIIRLENQLADLKIKLVEAETSASAILHLSGSEISKKQATISKLEEHGRWPLDTDEYKRYGRQLIMPEIGLKGPLLYPTYQRLGWLINTWTFRPTQAQGCIRFDCRCWRTWMSCGDIPFRCRCGHSGPCRR